MEAPAAETMSRDGKFSRCEVPKVSDAAAIGVLQGIAFREKRPCATGICCPDATARDSARDTTNVYQKYAARAPQKLEHGRIVRGANGTVHGYCQLQLAGDPANLHFPSSMRHELRPGEAYVETVCVAPEAQGKGIGSELLAWAEDYARTHGAIFISLEVMWTNPAAKLYRRKGYVKKPHPEAGEDGNCCYICCAAPFVFCCMGCRYCGLDYMAMPLAASGAGGAKPGGGSSR